MRLHLATLAGALALFAFAGICRADEQQQTPPSPLRLIPAESDFLIQAREPHKVADLVRKLEIVTQLQQLPFVKNQLDSTSARRALQLLAHFEKKMGDKWPILLEKLASGGIALGGKYGDNAPALLIIQGSDEKVTKQFVALAVEVIESELARQESKEKVQKRSGEGIDAYQVGEGFCMARMGAAIAISNKKTALGRAVALHLGKEKASLADHAPVLEARKLLPDKPLLDAWFDMAPAQKSDQAKELYKTPRDNAQLTVLLGAYLDIFGRTPFLAAALTQEKEGFGLTLRAPRGRDGMGPDLILHIPPLDKPGLEPLLEPKGVLYSSSFYLDIPKIWTDRDKLFTKANAKNLADADKNTGRFLLGTKVSQILESAGARHRIVVANQSKPGYKRTSKVTIPAFAFVPELSNPARFNRVMDLILRGLALAATNQFNLELQEEKYNGVEIVGYRFDEKSELPDDTNDIRFAFSPCWARVGNHFIFSSTIELCRDLIDALQAQKKNPGKSLNYTAYDRYYSAGFAQLLLGIEDQLITQAILDQSIEPAEAKKQVRQAIDFVKGLGDVTSYSDFKSKEWRYEFRFGK